MLKTFGGRLRDLPSALSVMLLAQDFQLDTAKEIIIVTPRSREQAEPFLAALRPIFLPNRILVVAVEGNDLNKQARLVPLLRGKTAAKGRVTAYVCERGACQLPTDDLKVFLEQIGGA